ncbi:unnamed protein product, partial [Didymodactylos carnosus]
TPVLPRSNSEMNADQSRTLSSQQKQEILSKRLALSENASTYNASTARSSTSTSTIVSRYATVPTGNQIEDMNYTSNEVPVIKQSTLSCALCSRCTVNVLCDECSTLKRGGVFACILQRLKRAADHGLESLENECNAMIPVLDLYPLTFNPAKLFDPKNTQYQRDPIGEYYLQTYCGKAWRTYLPVEIAGDGNCFYNSFITLSPSSNMTAIELRARNVIELVKNSSIYQKHYQDLSSCLDNFENYVTKEMVSDMVYSSLWDILSLTNVLQISLEIVYPRVNGGNDQYAERLNRKFLMINNGQSNHDIVLLWSSYNKLSAVRPWMPNHFVPLLSLPYGVSYITFRGINVEKSYDNDFFCL